MGRPSPEYWDALLLEKCKLMLEAAWNQPDQDRAIKRQRHDGSPMTFEQFVHALDPAWALNVAAWESIVHETQVRRAKPRKRAASASSQHASSSSATARVNSRRQVMHATDRPSAVIDRSGHALLRFDSPLYDEWVAAMEASSEDSDGRTDVPAPVRRSRHLDGATDNDSGDVGSGDVDINSATAPGSARIRQPAETAGARDSSASARRRGRFLLSYGNGTRAQASQIQAVPELGHITLDEILNGSSDPSEGSRAHQQPESRRYNVTDLLALAHSGPSDQSDLAQTGSQEQPVPGLASHRLRLRRRAREIDEERGSATDSSTRPDAENELGSRTGDALLSYLGSDREPVVRSRSPLAVDATSTETRAQTPASLATVASGVSAATDTPASSAERSPAADDSSACPDDAAPRPMTSAMIAEAAAIEQRNARNIASLPQRVHRRTMPWDFVLQS